MLPTVARHLRQRVRAAWSARCASWPRCWGGGTQSCRGNGARRLGRDSPSDIISRCCWLHVIKGQSMNRISTMKICHQELKFEANTEEGLDKLAKYRYRDYILSFDEKGQLVSCEFNEQKSNRSTSSSNSNSISPSSSSSSGCMITLLVMMAGLLSLVSVVFVVA